MRRPFAVIALLAAIGWSTGSLADQSPALSPAQTAAAANLVDIRTLVPDIAEDIKYAGHDNFVGAPVDGYEAPRCWLKAEAARALARVEAALRARHQRLRVFDCYRPARAVAHFMRWAADPADLRTKAAHYPGLDKPQLLGEYIAPVSGHSRGATVDLTLLQCDGRDAGVLDLLAREDRLQFRPGSAYRYSNSGYALLALVVERASGLAYPDFLRTRIFEPLGMHDTLAHVAGGPGVPHRAFGYSQVDGGWRRTDQSATSAVLGDGGIYSNIQDLARWDAALYDDRLLSDASRALAFAPQVEVTGEGYQAGYGFGWRITGDTLWHSGETIGFRNVIVRWPAQRLTVVLLSNRNDPEPYRTALAIGALFGGR
jgi:D-alanyl-D-alanine dipeptidase